MKRILAIIVFFFITGISSGQTYDAQVLLLNYEKYMEIKKTYDEIRKTYDILRQGYDKISGVASGDYDMHKAFLDGLKAVNPEVANYYKVAEIIKKQKYIIEQYGPFFKYVQQTERFTPEEIDYLKNMMDSLIRSSADSIDDLFRIITASQMNMSDDQRIKMINKLNSEVDGQLVFMTQLFKRVGLLEKFRNQKIKEANTAKSLN